MPLPATSNTSRPQSQGLHCRIGSDLYRMVALPDATPVIRTAPLQAPRIDTATNPEDIRPEAGTIYSLSDFTGGEGLDFAHRRNPNRRDPTRFWDSSGVDISRPEPGSRTSIRLLHETTQITTGTGTIRMAYYGGTLFATDGDDVKVSTNPTAATPTFTTESPHAGQTAVTCRDLAMDGNVLHAALGVSGIHQRTVGGTWSHWSDLDTTRLWFIKGRIVASTGPELYEAAAGAGSTLLHSLPTGHIFTAVVDVGSHVLAAATDGYIYSFTFDESSPALVLAARSPIADDPITAMSSMPGTGLVFYALASSEDATFVDVDTSTNTSIHRAQVADNGTLTNSQVVREFIHATDNQVVSSIIVDADQESVWYGKVGELWRLDLVTGGRSRDLTFSPAVRLPSLLSIEGRIFAGTESMGVYREQTTYVSSGYIITPLVDHFSSADKTWAGVFMDASPLASDSGQLSISFSTDPDAILNPNHSSWERVKNVVTGTDNTESILTAKSRYIALKIGLTSNADQTVTPHFRSVATRSFPGTGDIILSLPINTSDVIEVPGRQRLNIPGLGRRIYQRLRGIESKSVAVELYDPYELIQGHVESVGSSIPVVDVKGSPTFVTVVQIRGRRTALATTGGTGGLFATHRLLATTPTLAEVT